MVNKPHTRFHRPMKFDESADDAFLSKINVCRCNTKAPRFLWIKNSEHPTRESRSPFFSYLRHDMTLRVIEIILLCIQP